jgi:hypothetical protein
MFIATSDTYTNQRSKIMKKRLSLLIAVVLVVVTVFGALATPKSAKAVGGEYCFLNQGVVASLDILGSFPTQTFRYTGHLPDGELFIQTISYQNLGNGYTHIEVHFSVSNCTITFHDGRINNRDAGQTVAIYCTGGEVGGIFTLIPASPVWKLGLVVTAAEVKAVKPNPDHPVLIKKTGHVSLYRLQGGELQINAPGINFMKEDYNYIFNNCGL